MPQVIAFDLTSFGKLQVSGKDARSFLQNFTTNDVVTPGTGSGCETFVTTTQARMVAWLRVALRDNDVYANMEPGFSGKVISHLQKYVIGEEVTFEDRTDQDILWYLTGSEIQSGLGMSGLDIFSWQPWQHADLHWGNIPIAMQRCDFLGHRGFFLWTPAEHRHSLDAKWKEHYPLHSVSDPLWNRLRVEALTPAFGIDLDETMLPQEANRTEQAISFTKGCYLGQETVARIRAYGHVNRQLKRLRLAGNSNEPGRWTGALLKAGDKEVGRLKTVAWFPEPGCMRAIGLVRKEYLIAGTELKAVDSESKETTALIE